ncbi:HD-GYP domain-containing protein [Massilia sp. ST3]|uniref:HD-GYP domain-containing protein n=1 Tax=Massilia sp. ST3 TaxID=2824903 RepID=UPI001B8381E5|nr:HD domain-containing phosphohydrolase [Massilia sp. ST3]MBQ5948099.1 HD domain-containing protein [Massilia sp. ST3]
MSDAVVNKHYLEKVIELAEQLPVVATEDIYDARGNKLLAKGAKVSRVLQEKLILHKLTKPIEASLRVTGGVDANLVVKTAERLLADNQALAAIVAVSQGSGPSPLAMLSRLEFGNATTMMLTISERGGNEALDHAVTVAIAAACFAKHLGLSAELQQSCALAGLLHDIGELYIDPAYLAPGRQLLPHEWAHLVVHPRTSQMLIAEHETYPPEVARAIAEHHERLDGSGYPRRLAGAAISPCGQVLAAAEAVSAMLRAAHGLERAEVSLKLITSEHDRRIAAVVSRARQHLRGGVGQACAERSVLDRDARLYRRIVDGMGTAQALAQSAGLSPSTRELLERIAARMAQLQRAALSSGLDLVLLPEGEDGFDGLLVFEHAVATSEIGWRLRELSRELALATCSAGERAIMAPLLSFLDPVTGPALEHAA